MNVTWRMSKRLNSLPENGELLKVRVIPQIVSTLRKNLLFEGENKSVERGGTDPSPNPSMDEMNGKSFIRPTEH